MEAGRLDRKITILKPVSQQSEFGDELTGYVEHQTLPARVEEDATKGDGEKFEGDQLTASQFTMFAIRYRRDIERTMVIQYEGEWYEIHSVSEINRRRGLVILATWKDAQQWPDLPPSRILENNDIAAYEPKIWEG